MKDPYISQPYKGAVTRYFFTSEFDITSAEVRIESGHWFLLSVEGQVSKVKSQGSRVKSRASQIKTVRFHN